MSRADDARRSGDANDMLAFIAEDHTVVLDQLSELSEAISPLTRRRLLERLTAQLGAHEHMEEAVLYPALASQATGMLVVRRATEQHRAVDIRLERLRMVDPRQDLWESAVSVLQEAVRCHAFYEQDVLLPLAIQLFPARKLYELARAMRFKRALRLSLTRKLDRASNGVQIAQNLPGIGRRPAPGSRGASQIKS